MTSICLNTAQADNAGRFLDAGVTIEIGADDHMIDADRADSLVATSAATVIPEKTPAKADTKG